MPPQGESVGLALEDAILLSMILQHHREEPIPQLLSHYNRLRRPRIDAAVKEANFGFETIQDRGWLATVLMELLTWFFLLYRRPHKKREFAFDIRDMPLDS